MPRACNFCNFVIFLVDEPRVDAKYIPAGQTNLYYLKNKERKKKEKKTRHTTGNIVKKKNNRIYTFHFEVLRCCHMEHPL